MSKAIVAVWAAVMVGLGLALGWDVPAVGIVGSLAMAGLLERWAGRLGEPDEAVEMAWTTGG